MENISNLWTEIVIPIIKIEHVTFITNKIYKFNIITNGALNLFHVQTFFYVVMIEIEALNKSFSLCFSIRFHFTEIACAFFFSFLFLETKFA